MHKAVNTVRCADYTVSTETSCYITSQRLACVYMHDVYVCVCLNVSV